MPLAIATVGEDEYAPDLAGYVGLARAACREVVSLLAEQGGRTATLLAMIPEERAGFRYAPGKWSVRDIVGHLADSERVMGYRALCIARGESAPLPGFDEVGYAAAAGADSRPLADLAAELATVRAATLAFVTPLDDQALARRGIANQLPISVRALVAAIAGHELHHLAVLADRYQIAAARR